MFHDLKKKYEEEIKKKYEELLGDTQEIDVKWGYPKMEVILRKKKEPITIWVIGFNAEDESDFTLSTTSYSSEEDSIKPNWSSIDSKTLSHLVSVGAKAYKETFSTNDETEEKEKE